MLGLAGSCLADRREIEVLPPKPNVGSGQRPSALGPAGTTHRAAIPRVRLGAPPPRPRFAQAVLPGEDIRDILTLVWADRLRGERIAPTRLPHFALAFARAVLPWEDIRNLLTLGAPAPHAGKGFKLGLAPAAPTIPHLDLRRQHSIFSASDAPQPATRPRKSKRYRQRGKSRVSLGRDLNPLGTSACRAVSFRIGAGFRPGTCARKPAFRAELKRF